VNPLFARIQIERQWLFVERLMLKESSLKKKGPGHRATERPLKKGGKYEFRVKEF